VLADKFALPKELGADKPLHRISSLNLFDELGSAKSGSQMRTPANDRGRFVYRYFQCSEIDEAKWQIF
jgi:hypothetical protein